MFRKIKFLIGMLSLSICLCLMSTTYSRYVADATGNIEATFAKWQILVNNEDITNNSESSLMFEPIIEESEYIAPNKIAPTSKGYFDIKIDASNVEVSFEYLVNLEVQNENIPDLIITKYAILPDSYIEDDPIEIINLNDKEIKKALIFNKEEEDFKFKPFTIRIFFEWYEGEEELMNDEDDSMIGHLAATEDITLQIKADVSFKQIFE